MINILDLIGYPRILVPDETYFSKSFYSLVVDSLDNEPRSTDFVGLNVIIL